MRISTYTMSAAEIAKGDTGLTAEWTFSLLVNQEELN